MNATVDTSRREALAVLSSGRWDAVLVGTFALVVGVIGAGRPSLWLDEVATISGSTRTLPQTFDLLGHVDAVHGLYYLLMHAWFAVFPVTEFWARLPSALLVAAAASGVVVLGRQLSTRSVAIAAGVVFTVLPRTTWAGIEARPYALSMFDAVWLTVLLVVAVRHDRVWIWVSYAMALVLATVGNVFVMFIVAAHAVVVIGMGRSRRAVAVWACSVAAAVVVATPFLWAIKAQQSQVNWIWPVNPGTVGQLLGDQYFPAVYSNSARATALDPLQMPTPAEISAAVNAWALVAPFIIALLVVVIAAVRMRRRPGSAPTGSPDLLIWVAAAWIVVPTAVLIGYSLVREPMYQPHYLSFTAAGLALLLGRCVVIVGRQPRGVAVVLAVLVAAAIPNYVAQRGPYAKIGSDYSQVADLIATHAASNDCLNIDDTAPSNLIVAIKESREKAYAALRDDGQDRSAIERGTLFESRKPISAWAGKLRTCRGLWTITARDPSLPDHELGQHLAQGSRLDGTAAYQVPTQLGFRLVERWQFNLTQVVKSLPPNG